ncbi:MAG: Tryptophan synthase alpha chain [Labilithrix sp.]|nr:Tryptophan synthase alpha chain [Labilithrix sp.]
MRTSLLFSAGAALSLAALVVACSSSSSREGFPDNPSGAGDASTPVVPSLGEAGVPAVDVNVSGTVYAPNGSLPLSNTLVYMTKDEPGAIPEGAYCDTCVTLPENTFAYSAPDGTFAFTTTLPVGDAYLVVQKGQFRRVRKIKIKEGGDLSLEKADTTLPGRSDVSKGDDVPHMAILKDSTDFDAIDESLQKLGITDLHIENDHSMLENLAELMKYHIVFIPCGSKSDKYMTSDTAKANLQAFVAAGGKLYVTDWSYEFVRQPFPGYISWDAESATIGSAATLDEWDAPATAADQGLGDWLAATGDATFEVKGNWTSISGLNVVPSKDVNGDPVDVTPKVWVTAVKDGSGQERPTTVSFENQCGRVLFSTYHTEAATGGGGGFGLLAQEKALLYVLLEVGVCVGPTGGVK